MEAARAQLGSVLPALQQTLQQALEQTDLFLRQAESIPQSFEDVERWRQALLARFEEENASFHERSRSRRRAERPRPSGGTTVQRARPLSPAGAYRASSRLRAGPRADSAAGRPGSRPGSPAESPPLSVQRPNIKKTLDKYAI